MLYYLIYNLKDIFIAKYIFKLDLIPGVQIPTKTRREIIRDLSITLTNQSLNMPVNQPCWVTIANA